MKKRFCVLFGLEGVLVDTETSYNSIWKHLADKYGAETDNIEHAVQGKSLKTILNKYFSELTANEKQSLVNELNEAESKNVYSEINGVRKFIQELKDHNVKTALITYNSDEKLKMISEHTDLIDMMDVVLSSGHSAHDDRETACCFVAAGKELGYDAENCYLFESTEEEIQAANRAGIKVIVVSNSEETSPWEGEELKVIKDFTEFSLDDIRQFEEY